MSYSGSCRICGMLRHTLVADVCAKCQQYTDMSRQVLPGSISTGTLNPEHLIPVFEKELERVNPDLYRITKALAEANYEGGPIEYCNELFEALQLAAPTGFYFGSSDGDGADIGWWRTEE
jgi:hypothetical protein